MKIPGPIGRRDLCLLGGAALASAAASTVAMAAQAAPGRQGAAPFVSDAGVNEAVPAKGDLAMLGRMQHEWALSKLPHLYAQALDRADVPALDRLFTSDAVVIVRSGTVWDRPMVMDIPKVLRAGYRGTFHSIFNQTLVMGDKTAVGEVYCIARHLYPERDGRYFSNDMTLRYEDEYRLEADNHWRFNLRRIVLVAHEPMVEIAPPVAT